VEYSRKWVQNSEDRGLVALDVAFPPQGFDPAAPVLVLLHGLNGGSNESYVTSCVAMAQAKGWTVVVYIARGLDGTPLTSKTGTGFHGARLGDFHAVLTALANALPSGTPLVAGGWSMGAIVLAQYVCATPEQLQGSTPVKLGAAVCVCGTFDTLKNKQFKRSEELWQPVLTYELKRSFAAQWQDLLQACAGSSLDKLFQCVSMIDFDSATQAPLNGYSNVDEYYLEMSPVRHTARLAACQCPTLSVTALDDPIIHADTMLETAHMTQKNPNLFVLASKFGGHCGWPVGNRHSNMCEVGFSFMNQAILQFCESAISVGDIR